jgi:hypothetical protein
VTAVLQLKRVVPVASFALIGLLVFLVPVEAFASHFRYGSITWQRAAPGSRTVNFTLAGAWRSTSVGAHTLQFGDGASRTLQPTVVASGTDARGEAYTVVRYTVSHTYAGNGPYTAFVTSCCRISTLVNAADASFRVESVIDLRDPSNLGSPVSSIPVILQLPAGGVRTFVLPIADPDSRGYTCRMSTSAEAGWGARSQPTAGGRALTVTSGCMLSWDTSSASAGQKYAAQVMIDSNDTPSTDASRVALDFIIEITGPGGAPTCSGSSGTQTALVGVPFTTTFTGTDPNGGTLRVNHMGLPAGASLSPAAGTSHVVPFNSTFSWTPTLAVAGTTQAVLITYTDPTQLQAYCSFSVQVLNKQLAVLVEVEGADRQVINASHPRPQTVTYPLLVTNKGSGDATDSYVLSVNGGLPGWTASISPNSATLAPGESLQATVTVTAPAGLPEALPVDMTVVATSRTNPVISSSTRITTYTNPPPPVTGVATEVLFTSGANATVTSRLNPTKLAAQVRDTADGGTVVGPGKGVVTFYVAGRAVGTDRDADGDGHFTIEWVPGFGWNQNGTQPLLAIYSGIDLPEGQVDLLSSQATSALQISQPVDSDGDGLSDEFEQVIGSNPRNADTDGDGLSDGNEYGRGTDPVNADTDGDGLSDSAELTRGTDPVNADTDGDGFSDGAEVAAGTNPLDPNSLPVRPPQLTLFNPPSGSVYTPDSSAASATTTTLILRGDAGTPCQVFIYDNGVLIGSFTTQGPWSWSATLPLGSHTLTVVARNVAGSSTQSVTVGVAPNAPAFLARPTGIINATQPWVSWHLRTAPYAEVDVIFEDAHDGHGPTPSGTFIADANGQLVIILPRPPDCHPHYKFCPRVASSPMGACAEDQIFVDTQPPVLTCPAAVSAPWSTTATLLMVAADDSSSHVSPNPLSYLWEVVSAEGTVTQLPGSASYSQVFAPGQYTATVSVADAAGNVASCSTPVQVDRHDTVCSLPSATAAYGSLISLLGGLSDTTAGVSLGQGTLQYTLDGQPVSGFVDYRVLLTPGTHSLGVSYAGDSLYKPCAATATLEVVSTPGKITGGGSIDQKVRNFGFVVQAQLKKGGPLTFSGHLQFQDKSRGIHLSSLELTALGVWGPHGVFTGTATVNGVAGYGFVVNVEDNAEPGARVDRLRIRIRGPGLDYDSSALATLGGLLDQGGNIQLHR